MDNPEKPFTVLEWCAGYGGIGMGLKRVIRNMRTIAYSEIELFCCEVLASRMEAGQIDAAPIWTNIKSFPCERFRGMVDLLVAGYPCQPFSSAGKRKGEEDPRHLWPFIERAISDVRPNWVFCENVAGHLTLGFKDVCHDLDELGYEVAAGLFTAREVGLPHKRQRLFILAHDKSAGARLDERRLRRQPDEADGPNEIIRSMADPDRDESSEGRRPDAEVPGLSSDQGEELGPALSGGDGAGFGVGQADSGGGRLEEQCESEPVSKVEQGEAEGFESQCQGSDLAPAGPGSEQYWWEPARVLAHSNRSGGGSKSGNSLHEGRGTGEDRSKSLPQNPQRGDGSTKSNAESTCGDGSQLGNAPSERPRGGSEDGAGEQSEVPRQGLGDAGAGVGLADPEHAQRGRDGRMPNGNEWGSCSPANAEGSIQGQCPETVTPLGGGADGSTDRLDGPDLLAAYHALGSRVHSRVDELRALGNGVIPAVSAKAFITLYDELTKQ